MGDAGKEEVGGEGRVLAGEHVCAMEMGWEHGSGGAWKGLTCGPQAKPSGASVGLSGPLGPLALPPDAPALPYGSIPVPFPVSPPTSLPPDLI